LASHFRDHAHNKPGYSLDNLRLLKIKEPIVPVRHRGALERMTLRARLIVLVGFVLLVSLLSGGMLASWHAAQSARTEITADRIHSTTDLSMRCCFSLTGNSA